MPVSILTDSAASLPKDITTADAISVVPMWLTIGETSMHDGDLSLEEGVALLLARDQLLDHEVPDANDRHPDQRGDAEPRVVGDLPALAPLLPVGEQVDHDH